MYTNGLLFSLLFSCSSDKATDSADVSATAGCGVEISGSYPFPQAMDMYYRAPITVSLSEEDATAVVSLEDASGVAVDGAASVDGTELSFQPSAPLAPLTDYVAKVSYCGSDEPASISFRTSELGAALEGGNEAIVNKTFAVDLTSGIVVEPPGVGELLRALLENTFLIYGAAVENDEITVVSALSAANSLNQNFCVPTLNEFPPVDISQSPYFTLASDSLELTVAAYSAKVYNFSVHGTFASDLSYFGGAYLAGEIDTREVYPLLADFGIEAESAEDVCGLLVNLGVPCITCSSDGEDYCLQLVLDQLVANTIEDEIYPVCDSNCHTLCEENLDTCSDPQPQEQTCE